MQIRSASYNPLVAISAALLSLGLQIEWAIDPINGSDSAVGSLAAPLKTMDEFNARIGGNYVQVAATLQLLGDVLDAPLQLAATRFKLNASLTVSGTRTQTGSGTITLVTRLGNGGTTYPFQLTTTGVDWTTAAAGSQIVLQGGQVCWIRNVIDANNVVIGACTTLASNATFTPTNGLTFTVGTLSRALPPQLNVLAATSGNSLVTVLALQNLSFDGGNLVVAGAGVLVAGCELKLPASQVIENGSQTLLLFRSCRFSMSAGAAPSFKSSGGRVSIIAGCLVGTGATTTCNYVTGADNLLLSVSFYGINLFVTFCELQLSTGGVHFENITSGSAITVTFGGIVFAQGIANGRNCSGAGFGVDCTAGKFLWQGAANKPTIGIASGLTGDARLGSGATGLTFTYAQLGTGKQLALLDAIPPTTVQVQAGGYAVAAQIG